MAVPLFMVTEVAVVVAFSDAAAAACCSRACRRLAHLQQQQMTQTIMAMKTMTLPTEMAMDAVTPSDRNLAMMLSSGIKRIEMSFCKNIKSAPFHVLDAINPGVSKFSNPGAQTIDLGAQEFLVCAM